MSGVPLGRLVLLHPAGLIFLAGQGMIEARGDLIFRTFPSNRDWGPWSHQLVGFSLSAAGTLRRHAGVCVYGGYDFLDRVEYAQVPFMSDQ